MLRPDCNTLDKITKTVKDNGPSNTIISAFIIIVLLTVVYNMMLTRSVVYKIVDGVVVNLSANTAVINNMNLSLVMAMSDVKGSSQSQSEYIRKLQQSVDKLILAENENSEEKEELLERIQTCLDDITHVYIKRRSEENDKDY